jgi:hypothetical protein
MLFTGFDRCGEHIMLFRKKGTALEDGLIDFWLVGWLYLTEAIVSTAYGIDLTIECVPV